MNTPPIPFDILPQPKKPFSLQMPHRLTAFLNPNAFYAETLNPNAFYAETFTILGGHCLWISIAINQSWLLYDTRAGNILFPGQLNRSDNNVPITLHDQLLCELHIITSPSYGDESFIHILYFISTRPPKLKFHQKHLPRFIIFIPETLNIAQFPLF